MSEPKPTPGFKFCRNATCGVEVRAQHPTGACRAHRSDGKLRVMWVPPMGVLDPMAVFSTLHQQQRDAMTRAIHGGAA